MREARVGDARVAEIQFLEACQPAQMQQRRIDDSAHAEIQRLETG